MSANGLRDCVTTRLQDYEWRVGVSGTTINSPFRSGSFLATHACAWTVWGTTSMARSAFEPGSANKPLSRTEPFMAKNRLANIRFWAQSPASNQRAAFHDKQTASCRGVVSVLVRRFRADSAVSQRPGPCCRQWHEL